MSLRTGELLALSFAAEAARRHLQSPPAGRRLMTKVSRKRTIVRRWQEADELIRDPLVWAAVERELQRRSDKQFADSVARL